MMQVMILAAGRGQRMGELTAECPKPLLPLAGKPIIVRLIEQLRAAGLTGLVINHAWQGQRLLAALGDGSALGVRIRWSAESSALETAGGITNALPLLGGAPFAVINGDILTDFDFNRLSTMARRIARDDLLASCVLIPNPDHNPRGDFAINERQLLQNTGTPSMTFAGIGVYSPAMFNSVTPGHAAPLAPLLRQFADQSRVGAEPFTGLWSDIGTPERLAWAADYLNAHSPPTTG